MTFHSLRVQCDVVPEPVETKTITESEFNHLFFPITFITGNQRVAKKAITVAKHVETIRDLDLINNQLQRLKCTFKSL